MSRLVIEYLLEGHRRGYSFTSPTHMHADSTLKTVWRSAMPRGQGWRADRYIGARALKCFALENGQVAVSESIVTDMTDENGRRGIRRAEVDVMSAAVFTHHLRSRMAGYPPEIQKAAATKYAQVEKRFPRLKKQQPLVLVYPFTTPRLWWVIEALVLRLALAPLASMHTWGAVVPFTTLALTHLDETGIVAIPAHEAVSMRGVPLVDVSES